MELMGLFLWLCKKIIWIQKWEGIRNKIPSTRYKDFVTHIIQNVKSLKSLSAQYASSTPFPITCSVSSKQFSIRHQNFVEVATIRKEI